MVPAAVIDLVTTFTNWTIVGLIALLVVLVAVGFANALLVGYRTLGRRAATDGSSPLPQGFISMYAYLHLLADVLLVVVAIELIETFLAFLDHESPKAYLLGVLGAALVALARRVIVFFNPEAGDVRPGEMYGHAALVAALAAAIAVIQRFG